MFPFVCLVCQVVLCCCVLRARLLRCVMCVCLFCFVGSCVPVCLFCVPVRFACCVVCVIYVLYTVHSTHDIVYLKLHNYMAGLIELSQLAYHLSSLMQITIHQCKQHMAMYLSIA